MIKKMRFHIALSGTSKRSKRRAPKSKDQTEKKKIEKTKDKSPLLNFHENQLDNSHAVNYKRGRLKCCMPCGKVNDKMYQLTLNLRNLTIQKA